ncbi:hypothetical protein [Calycomorphotria hydatis]|uniref:Uncharacterized protein n=1 Tax=Calycomorphotria hydatis TaxID=2528027 RepID=A0A517T5Q0_9PLAN|nr:hypothetical protein [Calycomorphotria hydatis]QDT63688.1 hypothetical protein V22_09130 [Calycomorphotria hydatis]
MSSNIDQLAERDFQRRTIWLSCLKCAGAGLLAAIPAVVINEFVHPPRDFTLASILAAFGFLISLPFFRVTIWWPIRSLLVTCWCGATGGIVTAISYQLPDNLLVDNWGTFLRGAFYGLNIGILLAAIPPDLLAPRDVWTWKSRIAIIRRTLIVAGSTLGVVQFATIEIVLRDWSGSISSITSTPLGQMILAVVLIGFFSLVPALMAAPFGLILAMWEQGPTHSEQQPRETSSGPSVG